MRESEEPKTSKELVAKYRKPVLIVLVLLASIFYGAFMFSAGTKSGEVTVFFEDTAAEACYTHTFWSYITWRTHIECRGSWHGKDCILQGREKGTEKPWNPGGAIETYKDFYEYRCVCS